MNASSLTGRLAGRVTRLAGVAALAGLGMLGLAVSAAPAASAASAASASSGVGYIRLAHLSTNTPAVDVYLYSFRDPTARIVLRHVAYGTVSTYEQVPAGEYTVAMRGAGAAPTTKPVLSTTFNVAAGAAYTVAGVGPNSGLRLQVIPDRLTAPRGRALVRVIQGSMHQERVTVKLNGKDLTSRLAFSHISGYVAVRPGTLRVRAAGATASCTRTVTLTAGSIHTLVVLDTSSTALGVTDLMDAQGSKVDPVGGAQTGFGGTAPRPGVPALPWVAAAVAGLLAAVGGGLLVSRRRRPALHAR
jgi:hypothetical protein